MTEPSAPRHTDRPFPRYRFVPGEHPHPTAHPDGHSYGHEPEARLVKAEQWRDSPDYLFGADLYNHGFWWEAHEAWEGLWQLTDKQGTMGTYLKALIQVSACHLQFLMGQPRGVERLRRTSREYLEQVIAAVGEARYMGLALRPFADGVAAYYAERTVGGPHDPERFPYVVLGA